VSRSGIVLAGTVVLDIVNIIERWPEEEQIAFIRETIPAPGGPPHNAAAGLVKLGAPFPVQLIAIVGDDVDGDIFIEKAKGYGLDTSHMLRAKGVTTDITHVMTSAETGRRTFFFRPGANNTLKAEDLLPKDDSARIYYLGSPGGISTSLDDSDGWREILREVRARGFKTCMELCPVPPEKQRQHVRPCLPLLDYIVINDSEGAIVSGLPVSRDGRFDFALAEQACRKLLEMGVSELAVIHHPDGAVGVRRGGETARAASVKMPQSEVMGSVGAGDAFYAGVLFGLHEDWPLAKCLGLGNAAAATSLHSPTTSASIRPWAECLAYAERCGLRSSV
jgi:sugar/nucleoside kinase (ribokinase family)